jgi:hypothetical protein
MVHIRECERTICGAPKIPGYSIRNLDLNIRAGYPPVKSAHSSQATLDGLLHQESFFGCQAARNSS